MTLLFWGFFLAFFDFNITVGQSVVGLIPSFIGDILLFFGCRQMLAESGYFRKGQTLCVFAFVVSCAQYVVQLFVYYFSNGWWFYALGILGMVLLLAATYVVVRGIRDMEDRDGYDVGGRRLMAFFVIQAFAQGISYLWVLFFPNVSILCNVASGIGTLMFLIAFHQTKKEYLY